MSNWHVPKLWERERCFILGGSPCLVDENLDLIHNEKVIGTNDAYLLGDWVDACWFSDNRWWGWNKKKEEFLAFKGLKICCCPELAGIPEERGGIKVLHRGKPEGLEERNNYASWNHNTGLSAINLAVHLGVKQVFLLGFAMEEDKERGHNWHDNHEQKTHSPADPYVKFMECIPYIQRDADRIGVKIINCTMRSRIPERFIARKPLEEVMCESTNTILAST